MANLETSLRSRAAPAAAELTEVLENDRVRCLACGHRCRIPPGRRGVCKIRWNDAGTLMAPRGYVAGLAVDPIEKKPFYHVLPGSDALSFGMLGCDFHCSYCQNWLTSQALRDDAAGAPVTDVTAEEIVDLAVARGAPVVTSTYNEPLITSDWAAEIFDLAKKRGLLTSYVSNGNATPEVIEFLAPRLDLMKVDLKSFRPERYRELGGVLDHVLRSIQDLVGRGIWVEVVTLVVPGFNDGDDELAEIAGFLAGLSVDLPWHVTAFHPDYRMRDPRATPPEALIRAYDIGRAAGLRYVYPGNRAGAVGDRENTDCPGCGAVLVRRTGYLVRDARVTPEGTCPDCGRHIAGCFGR